MNLEPSEIPVALDFHLGSVRHRRGSYRRLRHRSGWMRVNHVYFRFDYSPLERQLVVCVDDFEDFIPPSVAERLLAMTTSLPYAPDEPEPFSLLDLVQSSLIEDFTHECNRETHKFLKQYEEQEEEEIRKAGKRYTNAISEVETLLRKLRSALRAPRLDNAQRIVIEEKITAIEVQYEKLPHALLNEERQIRVSGEQVEREVLSSLSRRPTCETIHTVRWRTVD